MSLLIKYGSIFLVVLVIIGGLYGFGYRAGFNAESVSNARAVATVQRAEQQAQSHQRESYEADRTSATNHAADLDRTVDRLRSIAAFTPVPSSGGSCTLTGHTFTDEQYYELANFARSATEERDDYATRLNAIAK